MKDRIKERVIRRQRRRYHIRHKLQGTTDRPRLSIYRSLTYIYGQIIDDTKGHTIVSLSDRAEETKNFLNPEKKGKVGRSFAAGKALAKIAKERGIEKVAFDRGGYLFHGRVKAFADGAREGGLKF